MNFEWIKPSQLAEVAAFIAARNCEAVHNIGYCGQNEQELLKTLREDFVSGEQTSIVAAVEHGEIKALIGLDIDEPSAEVWGPFTKGQDKSPQVELFKMLQQSYPNLTSYYFFINEMNREQPDFMEQVHGKKTGEHLLLEVVKATFEAKDEFKSSLVEQADFEQFKVLHNEAFPKTYYDAETILARVNESGEHVLRVRSVN